MDPLLRKLNYPEAAPIYCGGAPASFESILAAWREQYPVKEQLEAGLPLDFALVFVTEPQAVRQAMEALYPLLHEQSRLWFAYPKKSSPLYRDARLHRDQGWEALGERQWEPVRQVALDPDWSALRFRPLSQIKNYRRSAAMSLSAAGKARAQKDD